MLSLKVLPVKVNNLVLKASIIDGGTEGLLIPFNIVGDTPKYLQERLPDNEQSYDPNFSFRIFSSNTKYFQNSFFSHIVLPFVLASEIY